MGTYQVPFSLNALVVVEAKDKEELEEKLCHEVQKALKEGRFDYNEWQLVILEEQIVEE